MTSWLWAIPWVIIIIFSAGWHFGAKVATRREVARKFKEEADRMEERNTAQTISEIYKHLDNLENKIERIYATKEKWNNG